MNKLQIAFKYLTSRSHNNEGPGGVNTDASKNLFGTIATNQLLSTISTQMGFIPNGSTGETFDLTGNNLNVDARWLGLDNKMMQFWAYRFCSPLAAVIDRLAEADTNGAVGFLDADGIPIKNVNKIPALKRIKTLLNKPNPLQTWEEFNSEQVVLCKIFGYCPVFAVCPYGMDKSYTKMLWNINPFYAQPVFNYDYSIFDTGFSNPIKEWRLSILGKFYTLPSEDIILVKDGYADSSIQNIGLPLSKVAGLDFYVSNICAAMEADNVLLKKKGPLGVFSHDPKPDMAGWVPMTPQQKKDVQNDLDRYGLTLGQLQHVISTTPLKWNAMSFNLRDLMTKETVRQGIDGICDRLGYPAELMSGKNATYENRNSAEKYLYQNNVIPFSLRRTARYNEFFGLQENRLYIEYDHLPILQEDLVKAGEARKATSESVNIDWLSGLITYNEARTIIDQDPIAGMDIYYNEYIKKYPPPIKETKNEIAPKDTGTTE